LQERLLPTSWLLLAVLVDQYEAVLVVVDSVHLRVHLGVAQAQSQN
jgi:hypothetical protein